MSEQTAIKLFEAKQVRTAWNENEEEWYFSVVDVVGVLTEQSDQNGARNYWKVLKHRLSAEGSQTVTNCNQLKLEAETGKKVVSPLSAKKMLSIEAS